MGTTRGRKPFDRFMIANDIGRNLKLARFSDPEFRAVVSGVWPIASQATPRGAFMIGPLPATAKDVAFIAQSVSESTAQSAIERLRSLGMLEFDDELGGEWVHNWDLLNPAPKSDATNAERQRRWRERNAKNNASSNAENNGASNAVTNANVTPPEVEVEVEERHTDPSRAGVGVGDRPDEDRCWERWLSHHWAGRGPKPTFNDRRRAVVRRALKLRPVEVCLAAIDGHAASDFHNARGKYAGGKRFTDISYALRARRGSGISDEAKIDEWAEAAAAAGASASSPLTYIGDTAGFDDPELEIA